MAFSQQELDERRESYKQTMAAWIKAIEQEVAVCDVDHSEVDMDKWSQLRCVVDDAECKAKEARKHYDDSLREEFFGF